jgi:hypothetical protein
LLIKPKQQQGTIKNTNQIKSSPKILKLVNISRGNEEAAKTSYGSYPTEFVFEVKNEN